ncbi:hypothetical protein ACQ4LE_001671 [Meloidogyne hapla]
MKITLLIFLICLTFICFGSKKPNSSDYELLHDGNDPKGTAYGMALNSSSKNDAERNKVFNRILQDSSSKNNQKGAKKQGKPKK